MLLLKVTTFSSLVTRMVKYQVALSVLPLLLSTLMKPRTTPACSTRRVDHLFSYGPESLVSVVSTLTCTEACVFYQGELHDVGKRSLVFEYGLCRNLLGAPNKSPYTAHPLFFFFFGRIGWWGTWVLISIHSSLHPVLMEFLRWNEAACTKHFW